uniref:CSON006365 protein n=1 Tax=Culicoides sonorensis TaxID=179676 RepID=A0A336M1A2_CULSO
MGSAHKRSLTHEPHRAVYKTTHGKAHPDYNQRNLNNDVGLLYFEEEVKYTAYVQPATVYAHHVSEDRTVVVSGWGLMNDHSAQPAETLQFAPLVTMKNKDCAAVYSNDVVKETVVCAKGVTNESACNGDSGGPLVLEDTHELVGVVSFGHAAGCEKGFPNGYSRVNTTPITRIVNGEEAKPGQFPHQVLLRPDTGNVISDRFVLTAAHCVKNMQSIEVHLGAHDRTNPNEEGRLVFNSTEFKAHEKFNLLANNDVGLVKLPEAVKFSDKIKPVKLPKNNNDKYENEMAVVSGWGLEHTGGSQAPHELRFTELRVISNAECKKVYNGLIVKDSTICAKGEEKESACNGDSGGPLVHKETGELIGVVSFVGVEGCEVGLPVGFARVTKFLDWIQKNSV